MKNLRRAATVALLLAGCGDWGRRGHVPADPDVAGASAVGGGSSGSAGGAPSVGGAAATTSSGASSGVGGDAQGEGGGVPLPPVACSFGDELTWPLPAGFSNDDLDTLSKDTGAVCVQGELSVTTLDMNGDLRPDLVVTDQCDFGGVGSTNWLVYLNEGAGFASSPIEWALPSGFGTDQLDDAWGDDGGSCVESELSVATLDMDGDLRPDLVVADRCDSAGVGSGNWLVYLNVGDGFAATPVVWTLPSGFATDQLDDLAEDSGATCAQGELSYGTLDMNGDLRPDLVVADDCDAGGVGTTHWLVYLNTGDGFGSTPIEWSLPSGYASDRLDDLEKDSGAPCAQGRLAFTTVDMDADSRPDLVVTNRCDIGGVGTQEWLVYINQGAGFADAPVHWALPGSYGDDGLATPSADSGAGCFVGELSFSLVDGNGDRRPDLVVTDRCDADGVGTSHWLLYLNTGAGFDEAGAWLLPSTDAGFGFDSLDDVAAIDPAVCAVGAFSYAAIDVDGDRVLDLVVTDDCDYEDVGTTHYRVFRGSCSE